LLNSKSLGCFVFSFVKPSDSNKAIEIALGHAQFPFHQSLELLLGYNASTAVGYFFESEYEFALLEKINSRHHPSCGFFIL